MRKRTLANLSSLSEAQIRAIVAAQVERDRLLRLLGGVFAGNLRGMYRAVVAQGSDVDERGTIHCGSLLIGEMTIAGD